MSSLPIDTIANIASFLTLREQVKAFPEFNDCLKQVEGKKKLIRRVVYNWRMDFLKEDLNPATYNFKRYTPLAFRKQIVEEHNLKRRALGHVLTFDEIVDTIGPIGKAGLLLKLYELYELWGF